MVKHVNDNLILHDTIVLQLEDTHCSWDVQVKGNGETGVLSASCASAQGSAVLRGSGLLHTAQLQYINETV